MNDHEKLIRSLRGKLARAERKIADAESIIQEMRRDTEAGRYALGRVRDFMRARKALEDLAVESADKYDDWGLR